MSILTELSPIRNWQGWLTAFFLLAAFAVVGTLDGPEQQEQMRRAAMEIQAEARVNARLPIR